MNLRQVSIGAAVVGIALLAAWAALEVPPSTASPPRATPAREVRPHAEAPAPAIASAPAPAAAPPTRGLFEKGRVRLPPGALEDPVTGATPLPMETPTPDAGAAGWEALASGEDWADPDWFPDGVPQQE